MGSVAEEAAKLVGALQDWAREAGESRTGGAASPVGEGVGSVWDHVGQGPSCRLCPVCVAINRMRSTSPEVREHLAAALGSLAQAATIALRQSGATPGEQEAPTPTRIDLDD